MLDYEGPLSLHIWWLIILGKGLLLISSIIFCICWHIRSRYLLMYSGHILLSKSISSWYTTPRASSVFTGCFCMRLSRKITSLLCTIFLFTGSHNLYPISPSSPHPFDVTTYLKGLGHIFLTIVSAKTHKSLTNLILNQCQ